MGDLDYARAQMALSLAFHIVFAAAGVAMPAMMAIAEWRWLATGDPGWRQLSKRWAKGTAILFAVGAVSGTVLAFELGLLWPRFMELTGSVIGLPFALEGFAFFTEAIFLGIVLYGWNRVPPAMHLFAVVATALSGAASAAFVTCANAWMNAPVGFRLEGGRMVDIDPLAAMLAPGFAQQVIHVLLSCYLATAIAVAGIHALRLRRHDSPDDRKAFSVALAMAAITAVLQVISGDFSARSVHDRQPIKLAAMEGQFATERGAPLRIGGWPDLEAETTRWALEIPHALSLLATHDPDAEIVGLSSVPRSQWPSVKIVHAAFQVMVGIGGLLLLTAFFAGVGWWRAGRRLPQGRRFLGWVAVMSPLGFVALQAGWVVTECGRQPWIVQGIMRTESAVTPMRGLALSFWAVTAVYALLAIATWLLLRRQMHEPERRAP